MCTLTSFRNGGFETGNSDGWIIGGGTRTSIFSSNIDPNEFLPGGSRYDRNIVENQAEIVETGKDKALKDLMPKVTHSGNYAWRVGDTSKGGHVSVISQKIKGYYCLDIYFAWLAVLENGNHSAINSSIMVIELKDSTVGDSLLIRRYDAGVSSNGVDARFERKNSYFYTPSWQIEHLRIDSSRTGHDFTLTVLAADCRPSGHKGYIYLDSFGGVPPSPTTKA